MFERNSLGRTILHTVALYPSEPHLEMMKYILSVQPKLVNDTAYAGETALHIAAANLNIDGVKMLLGAGALVNILDDKGVTPLDVEPAIRNVMIGAHTLSRLPIGRECNFDTFSAPL